jgi:hypothetical protein
MGDRQHSDGRRPILGCCNDRQHQGRAILVTLLPVFEMLPVPEIGIAENPTDLRLSRQNACRSTIRH